ncbi:MAG TPA: aminopeptidase N [Streptosporangiaceae bacterium]|nr:aminopeptidase N [Streptosporangiaceae bacterium]
MTSNLTRDEAQDRAQLLQVTSYRVELDVTGGEQAFPSVSTVHFRCARPGAASFIDLTAPAVTEIMLNGEPLPLAAFDGDRIALADLAAENELRVAAECAYSRSGEGMHRFTDPADGGTYLYTDLETFDAHRVYACFDQPDLKASFELAVTTPEGWLAVSNMAPDVAGELAGDGVIRWHFPPSPVMSTYITAAAAGPYHVVRSEHDGIPLGIFCRRSLAPYLDPDEIFEVTRQGFDYFHRQFGVRYQFGKYDQLFVPEFKAGAMENAGAVTFLEDYIFRSRVTDFAREVRAETILHEMAHMWFGDLVTMRWWDDLWLNESFATWAATLAQAEATRWRSAWTTFAQLHKAWAYRQDQLPSTHPIAADIPDIAAVEVNFDGITYAKGAAVLKQLVAYVGLGNFLAGLREYFGQHAWSNATLADLLAPVAATSGRNLADWSKQWLETAGVNTLRPEYATDGQGAFTEFAVRQDAPPSHPVLRDHRIAIGLYDRTPAGLVRRLRVETDIAGEHTVVGELAGLPRPDLVLVNDDDLSYAKIRLDEHSLGTLITSIGSFTDSLPAALCWAAAWDMCRDAELAARDYLRLVLTGVGSVTGISVAQTLLRQASAALRRYTDPAWRPAGLELTASRLRELLAQAEPGSDTQLAYVQALAGVATSPADLALLAGLLDGTRPTEGLAVDTELRWRLLRRLVSRGAAGQHEIEAELRRDATDAGERHAATCRAAIPDPAAKEAAWQRIVAGTLPNAVFRAELDGFVDYDHPELMAPYQRRYFEVVGDIWRDWSSDMAQWFVANAYPMSDTPEVIEATDELIERTSPPPALRRLLIEGRDGVERALRCQARDRQAS